MRVPPPPGTIAAVALLLSSLLAVGSPARSAEPPAADGAGPRTSTWDLLSLAAPDAKPGSPFRVTTITNFDEQRRVVASPIPQRLAYPVEIPPNARLEFGTAIQSRIFSIDFIPKAGPTRFRVTFTDENGTDAVLHERVVNLRDREADRRWFDERIDLTPLAGRRGTLAFEVELDGTPKAPAETTALFASPRILVDPAAGEWNLLFITIDCLRADHVGAYGYPRATTPTLDSIAAEGIRFAHAYTSAPMTLPSLPQIFTSRVFPTPGQPTWVTPFARAGIPTAAVANNVWLVLWLSRNSVPFDTMVTGDIMGQKITDEALRWLERHGDDRFALYLHYLDAHTPYNGPREYARMFKDPDYSGPIGDSFGDVDAANAGVYSEADKARIVSLYDGNVRFIDDQLGRIFATLREKKLLDKTLVVISADHGEEFWDHGKFFHGQSLYDELLHVPLIVRLPGAASAGTVVERPVRSIDIAPSLLAWTGFAAPDTFTGRPLSEAIGNPSGPADDLFATATMGQFPTRYGLRTPERKLVDTVDTGEKQLFDLGADPGEKHDVLAEHPAEARAMEARLAGAREELLNSGLQVKIVGPRTGKASFRLALESQSESGVFETLDRTGGPTDAKVSMSADGRNLFFKGETDAAGRSFRVDRRLLLLAAMSGKADPLRATLLVDGAPAPDSAIELGAGRPLGPTSTFEVSSADFEVTAAPACPAPGTGVRVCLWRPSGAPPEAMPVLAPIPDPSARERLRALGYVQ